MSTPTTAKPAKPPRQKAPPYQPRIEIRDPGAGDYLVLAHDGHSWRRVNTRHYACSCTHGQYRQADSPPCSHIQAAVSLETTLLTLASLLVDDQRSALIASWKLDGCRIVPATGSDDTTPF